MSEFKLVTITWSTESSYDITNEFLYKSFKFHNPDVEILHSHFNINDYVNLRNEFSNRFGVESDYILFKVQLLNDIIKNIDSKYIIFCDARDVTCLSSIDHLPKIFDLNKYVIIGHEKNQWPPVSLKNSWPDYTDYSDYDLINQSYLNSGMILAKKENFVKLLNNLIDKVLTKNINNHHNDQGVFTYYYNTFNKVDNLVKLDYSSLFAVNTFSRTHNEYELTDNDKNISSKFNGIKPCFIHDNGFHGGPKYREHFKIQDLYLPKIINNNNLNLNITHLLEQNGEDYHVLSNAAKNIKNISGIVCEIGTRKGGGLKLIIESLIENGDYDRNVIGLDPYGNIDYQFDQQKVGRCDYTNTMRNETLCALYSFINDKRVNLVMFILEDSEFFEKFKNGIPFYNEEKIILNQYALVYFDGPHSTELIMKEIEFFNERTPIGGYWVFDDVDNGFYPHNEQIEPWLLNNGYKMVEKTRCKASYVKLN